MTKRADHPPPAIGGIASAHLVAGLTNPATSPVLAVGSVVIDATPTPIKEYAVAQLGTADKPILLASVTLVTLLAAAVAGLAILLGLSHALTGNGASTPDEPTAPGEPDHELPATAYPTSHDGRRQFLIGAAAVTVGAAGAAAFGQNLTSADFVPQSGLPAAADPATAFPRESRLRCEASPRCGPTTPSSTGWIPT